MNIFCKQTTSAGFNLKEVTTIFSNDFDYGNSGLELGKEYLVMGLVIYTDSKCLYYLIDACGRPNWFPYLLFDVIDPSIPKDWSMKIINDPTLSDIYFICGFPELCSANFYDQLVDREKRALQIYFNKKEEMEKDDVSLTCAELQNATQIEDFWLMCPVCIDGWEEKRKHPITRCPSCHLKLHNPLFKK